MNIFNLATLHNHKNNTAVERVIHMCICLCFGVSKSELKKAIRADHDSIENLSEHIQISRHCGDCIGRKF
jgi:bacterioferritin-associated ferredoxin